VDSWLHTRYSTFLLLATKLVHFLKPGIKNVRLWGTVGVFVSVLLLPAAGKGLKEVDAAGVFTRPSATA
jgi:hypothetical protein